jgi:hypothetical protein
VTPKKKHVKHKTLKLINLTTEHDNHRHIVLESKMTEGVQLDYISVGGNRHPSSADWSTALGGYIAYGAGNSIALWSPLVRMTIF